MVDTFASKLYNFPRIFLPFSFLFYVILLANPPSFPPSAIFESTLHIILGNLSRGTHAQKYSEYVHVLYCIGAESTKLNLKRIKFKSLRNKQQTILLRYITIQEIEGDKLFQFIISSYNMYRRKIATS